MIVGACGGYQDPRAREPARTARASDHRSSTSGAWIGPARGSGEARTGPSKPGGTGEAARLDQAAAGAISGAAAMSLFLTEIITTATTIATMPKIAEVRNPVAEPWACTAWTAATAWWSA